MLVKLFRSFMDPDTQHSRKARPGKAMTHVEVEEVHRRGGKAAGRRGNAKGEKKSASRCKINPLLTNPLYSPIFKNSKGGSLQGGCPSLFSK